MPVSGRGAAHPGVRVVRGSHGGRAAADVRPARVLLLRSCGYMVGVNEQNRPRRAGEPADDDDPELLDDDYTEPDPVRNMVDEDRNDTDDGDAAILAHARRDLERTIGRRRDEPARLDPDERAR